MFKQLFCFFLILHILGDFYFQSGLLSARKQSGYKYIVLHNLLYFLISFLCIIPVWSIPVLISAGILVLLHFIVDSVLFLYTKSENIRQNAGIYTLDQFLHLLCVANVAILFVSHGYRFSLLPQIRNPISVMADPGILLGWAGLALTVSKPANIIIKELVSKYKPKENASEDPNRTGAFIGTLERIIILLLLSVGEYSAIGLVLTAKSIARYNKISEDKQFAEYYLLGTLLSTLYAIASYFVFM